MDAPAASVRVLKHLAGSSARARTQLRARGRVCLTACLHACMQVSDITNQCKELWKQREAATKAAGGAKEEEGRGFFGWGAKKAAKPA